MAYNAIRLHPSIFSFDSLEAYPQEVESLCQLLYNRNLDGLERAVLTVLVGYIDSGSPSGYSVVHSLLHDFNLVYIQWLYNRQLPVRKELDDINSLEHDNYLLAYCQGVTEMEAILETAEIYFMAREKEKKETLLSMIETYRRWFCE